MSSTEIEEGENKPRQVVGYIQPITMENINLSALDMSTATEFEEGVGKFIVVFDQQDSVNKTVAAKTGVDWKEMATSGKWDFLYAGAAELVEMANSREDLWKWWVKQEPPADLLNIKLELVDAFHFFISYDLSMHNDNSSLANQYQWAWDEDIYKDIVDAQSNPIMFLLKEVISSAAQNDHPYFDVDNFFLLCKKCGMTRQELHAFYMGKAVLNKFRQKNGYKEGKYWKKWWNEEEDNFYLMRWLTGDGLLLDGSMANLHRTPEEVENYLDVTYKTFLESLGSTGPTGHIHTGRSDETTGLRETTQP